MEEELFLASVFVVCFLAFLLFTAILISDGPIEVVTSKVKKFVSAARGWGDQKGVVALSRN